MTEIDMVDDTPESERVKKQDEAFEAAIPTDEDSLLQALSLFVEQKHSLHVPARPTDADLVLRKGIKELTEARAKITALTRERDEWHDQAIGLAEDTGRLRSEIARLRGALETLSTVERHYRDMYHRHGGQALDTRRAWDMLRKAGIEARSALAGEGETKRCAWTYDETHFAWDSSCGEKWILMDGGPSENKIRFCHGCGKPVEVACEATPEKARQA